MEWSILASDDLFGREVKGKLEAGDPVFAPVLCKRGQIRVYDVGKTPKLLAMMPTRAPVQSVDSVHGEADAAGDGSFLIASGGGWTKLPDAGGQLVLCRLGFDAATATSHFDFGLVYSSSKLMEEAKRHHDNPGSGVVTVVTFATHTTADGETAERTITGRVLAVGSGDALQLYEVRDSHVS